MEVLLVVACHDRCDFLNYWVDAVNKISIPDKCAILLVNTCSTNQEFHEQWNKVKAENHDDRRLLFDNCERGNYATGAYWLAYWRYQSKKYIFLQDSVEITHPNFFQRMKKELESYDVANFYDFNYDHLGGEFTVRDIPGNGFPACGIFGPIFAVRRSILKKISQEWVTLPENKDEEEAWERRWALIFFRLGATRVCLSGDFGSIWTHHNFLKKTFAKRS